MIRIAHGDPVIRAADIAAEIQSWPVGCAVDIGWSAPDRIQGCISRGRVITVADDHTSCTVDLDHGIGVTTFPDVSAGWQCHYLARRVQAGGWSGAMTTAIGGQGLAAFDCWDVLTWAPWFEAQSERERLKDHDYLQSKLRAAMGLTQDASRVAKGRDACHSEMNMLMLALEAWCKETMLEAGNWRREAHVCTGDHILSCLGAYKVRVCNGSLKVFYKHLQAEPGIRGRIGDAVRKAMSGSGNGKDDDG